MFSARPQTFKNRDTFEFFLDVNMYRTCDANTSQQQSNKSHQIQKHNVEDMLQNAEERQVEYKQRENETLVEWYQGQIEAYRLSLELVRDLVSTYNRL